MKKSYIISTVLATVLFSGCMGDAMDRVNPMNYEYPSLFESNETVDSNESEEVSLDSLIIDDKEKSLKVMEQRIDTIETALIDKNSNNIDEKLSEISSQLRYVKSKLSDIEKRPVSSGKVPSNIKQDLKDLKQEVTFLKILNKRKNEKIEKYDSLEKKYGELENKLNRLEKDIKKLSRQSSIQATTVTKSINKPITVAQKIDSYTKAQPSRGYFIVTARQANVRAKASLNSRIVKIAREDEIFKILSIQDSEGITWIETDRGFLSMKTGEKIDSE